MNASNLHLETRRDFVEWSNKVVALERENVFVVLRLGWEDTEQQELVGLERALLFVRWHREQGRNIAVHCAQGKSRSGAVMVAFLMALQKSSFEEALKFAQRRRAMIEPNHFFEKQLIEKTKELHHLFGKRLVWITGQSGSGKTTLGNALRDQCEGVQHFDGDVFGFGGDALKFSGIPTPEMVANRPLHLKVGIFVCFDGFSFFLFARLRGIAWQRKVLSVCSAAKKQNLNIGRFSLLWFVFDLVL